jgi:hypothetical protein
MPDLRVVSVNRPKKGSKAAVITRLVRTTAGNRTAPWAKFDFKSRAEGQRGRGADDEGCPAREDPEIF